MYLIKIAMFLFGLMLYIIGDSLTHDQKKGRWGKFLLMPIGDALMLSSLFLSFQ